MLFHLGLPIRSVVVYTFAAIRRCTKLQWVLCVRSIGSPAGSRLSQLSRKVLPWKINCLKLGWWEKNVYCHISGCPFVPISQATLFIYIAKRPIHHTYQFTNRKSQPTWCDHWEVLHIGQFLRHPTPNIWVPPEITCKSWDCQIVQTRTIWLCRRKKAMSPVRCKNRRRGRSL